MHIIDLEEIDLGEKEKTRESLKEKIDNDCLGFIKNKEGKTIGFYTWREYKTYKRIDVLINNFVVLKNHRRELNLLELRKKFLEKFPNATSFYWDNFKKDKRTTVEKNGDKYVMVK